ncbi:MAG: hydroxymethylglutaryl-CoA lyase [Crocinitomicaceae bacterium]|nr:hydroxymethylglutaryl-CoA lyase [Crocinitomicaceae bacterium]MDP4865732.1 hydroxymethylglutaryl-CoA lyase [Crocinitomicaceae bacterium]MDP5010619.1 hydroxymethylglutaryl-CoA lyase [Crocinitomicaceae bacterium]MDP5098614.1 hydroxymethylglutaryl-CoA lyase [Crocinitomicaceae bacterium]
MAEVKLIECPRDAMQGLHDYIPSDIKVSYINQLLNCGFDTLDFGSFVSPKAIPQMRDTADVLGRLDLNSSTKLLAIIANERGAEEACSFEEIDYLGYPFSISETFQQRNTNASIAESFKRIEAIQSLAIQSKKKLVVYLSMGFGNPYGEEWNADIVLKWSNQLYNDLGIDILALSDTIGSATIEDVAYIYKNVIPELANVEFGAHLHTRPENAKELVKVAFENGCRRFDGAIKGFGGCPMASDNLTGNMPTELMLDWFIETGVNHGVLMDEFEKAFFQAKTVFPS